MGRDKALLPLNGKPMIEHVASALRSVLGTVCVVSDRTGDYRFLNLPVIPDVVKNAGPIGGIHAALTTLDAPAVLAAGCDTPFLSPPLFEHMLSAPRRSRALVAGARDGLHPLCAIYRREALPCIERFLADGRLRLLDLLKELRADIVEITPDLPFYHADLFANLNDPPAHLRYHDARPSGSRP